MEQDGDANDASAIWSNDPASRRSTRPSRDPNLAVTKLTVSSLEEFETSLRSYLDDPGADPEHSQCEIEVWGGVTLLVANTDAGHLVVTEKKPLSIAEALIPQDDTKETMKRQRSIAKCFIESIQHVDGFRYAFHNNWKSGDDYRFSYYCNDSLLNKDRVANGKTGSAGKRAYKPVYDCKGVMAVKFNSLRQCADIVYRHIPLHETYEERAPPPRKDAKRRRDWEIQHPNRVRNPQYLDQAIAVAREQEQNIQPARVIKPKEKKKKAKKSSNTAEADLRQESLRSLLELIRTEEEGNQEPGAESAQAAADGNQHPNQPEGEEPSGPQEVVQANRPQPNKPRNSCAICRSKRMKCDGQRPHCHSCRMRSWPCFYLDPDSPDNRLLPQMPADPTAAQQYSNASQPVPIDLTAAGPPAVTPDVESQLFETKTELALIKEKLVEAEERVKQLEAEKIRPTPAPRRTPQVSGIRSHAAHDDRTPQSNGYSTMAYQIAQTTNQSYPTATQTQTPTQPNYGTPQVQRQNTFPSPATQPTYAPAATSTAGQQNANNLYGRQMQWGTPAYAYQNLQTPQTNAYQGMSSRMR
ncbi:hypothetical protein NA57DRAFT_70261 [Rhizodiscina lignyota]|uniref:Zn(2)-C6 fungal-type domain-containing protein n=1 Tax=Rhizodiscina lignyota TaxID=1504668 RepID=A0A9P4MG06_9PEZI|nr:hypothetical protein NA57DRAFT_70261 [Rhizodiscina lignyota]